MRRFCVSDVLNSTKEPEGLASGKATKEGGFVHENEKSDENKDEEIKN